MKIPPTVSEVWPTKPSSVVLSSNNVPPKSVEVVISTVSLPSFSNCSPSSSRILKLPVEFNSSSSMICAALDTLASSRMNPLPRESSNCMLKIVVALPSKSKLLFSSLNQSGLHSNKRVGLVQYHLQRLFE